MCCISSEMSVNVQSSGGHIGFRLGDLTISSDGYFFFLMSKQQPVCVKHV